MNPTGQNPALNNLLANLLKSGLVNDQQVKPVRDAESYYNATNTDIMKSAQALTQGGMNGYAVNAGPAVKAWDTNTAATAGIPLRLAENLNNNANTLLGNLLNAATTREGQQLQHGVDVGRLNLDRANAGWGDPYTGGRSATSSGGSGNVRVDTWANAIMSGQKSINEMPQELSTLVLQELTKKGYDPARGVKGDRDSLMQSFGYGNSSLAAGNNIGQTLKNNLGSLLDAATRGGYQTETQQRLKSYNEASENFKRKWEGVLGKGIDLPKSTDSAKVANEKWAKITKQIQNYYYQGGAGPGGGKPSLDAFMK